VNSKPRTARDVLNELRWREGKSLKDSEIWYADRMKPEGYKIIQGGEISELGRGYFTIGETMLPYYKIVRITYRDEVIFERKDEKPTTDK